MTVKATIPEKTVYKWVTKSPERNDKLYLTVCLINYLLERVTKNAPFYGKINTLICRFGEVNIKASGFPELWKEDEFWKTTYIPFTHRLRAKIFKAKNFLNKRKPIK